MKQFACGTVVAGCAAVFSAETEHGILEQVARHARADHGMDQVPDAVVDQVRKKIADV